MTVNGTIGKNPLTLPLSWYNPKYREKHSPASIVRRNLEDSVLTAFVNVLAHCLNAGSLLVLPSELKQNSASSAILIYFDIYERVCMWNKISQFLACVYVYVAELKGWPNGSSELQGALSHKSWRESFLASYFTTRFHTSFRTTIPPFLMTLSKRSPCFIENLECFISRYISFVAELWTSCSTFSVSTQILIMYKGFVRACMEYFSPTSTPWNGVSLILSHTDSCSSHSLPQCSISC